MFSLFLEGKAAAYFDRPPSNVQSAYVDVAIASRRNRDTAGLCNKSGEVVRKVRRDVVDIGISFLFVCFGWRELVDCQRLYRHLLLARLS